MLDERRVPAAKGLAEGTQTKRFDRSTEGVECFYFFTPDLLYNSMDMKHVKVQRYLSLQGKAIEPACN